MKIKHIYDAAMHVLGVSVDQGDDNEYAERATDKLLEVIGR